MGKSERVSCLHVIYSNTYDSDGESESVLMGSQNRISICLIYLSLLVCDCL